MAGYQSNGFIFSVESITPGTFTTVTQVMSCTPLAYERNTAEVYTTDAATPTVLFSTIAAQEFSVTLLWDPAIATHEAFRTDFLAKTARNYRIVYPDTGAYQVQVNAVPTNIEYSELTGEGSEITMTVTFKGTAAPTITV